MYIFQHLSELESLFTLDGTIFPNTFFFHVAIILYIVSFSLSKNVNGLMLSFKLSVRSREKVLCLNTKGGNLYGNAGFRAKKMSSMLYV